MIKDLIYVHVCCLCMCPDLNAALCILAAPVAPSAGGPSSLPVSVAQCGRSVSL